MYQFKQASFFNAGSYSLSHKLASITAREAPIAKLSFCTYHKPLHLKCTLLTAKFSNFFIVLRDVSGGLTSPYNLLKAISTAFLSGTLVYKLFIPREIILSSKSSSVLSKMSQDFTLSQDHPLECWDTSHCPKTLRPSVGTLHTVPRPSVEHLVLSQDLTLKYWDISHCPRTAYSSVGTLRTVPRPFALVLGQLTLSQDIVLGHLVLSQDLTLKCCDVSHCPKTTHSSVGTLRTVPRHLTQVLGHFALSQDLPLKCWDTSYCLKTLPLKCWDTSHLPAQELRLLVLSPDLFVPVLRQSDLLFFGVGTLRSLSPVPSLES